MHIKTICLRHWLINVIMIKYLYVHSAVITETYTYDAMNDNKHKYFVEL